MKFFSLLLLVLFSCQVEKNRGASNILFNNINLKLILSGRVVSSSHLIVCFDNKNDFDLRLNPLCSGVTLFVDAYDTKGQLILNTTSREKRNLLARRRFVLLGKSISICDTVNWQTLCGVSNAKEVKTLKITYYGRISVARIKNEFLKKDTYIDLK